MGASHQKKKAAAASRRLRERTRLSFLFVVFFFGLFSLILLMENFSVDVPEKGLRNSGSFGGIVAGDEGDEDEDAYSNDITYDEGNKPAVFEERSSEGKGGDGGSGKDRPKFFRSTSTTERNPFQRPITIDSDWQKVSGTKEKFYVYSAHLNRQYGSIRVIGATKTKSNQKVQCRFYDDQIKHILTVDATIKTIRENWNLKYSACFIICFIGDQKITTPHYVSIVSTNTSPGTSEPVVSNLLKVQFPDEKIHDIVNFSVCVKPVHFQYDKILEFIEWMEFHRMMGVERFTFYNHTIGDRVGCVMREYGFEKDMKVHILPWSLPFVSQKEIRTEGLFAALNDCVYRHRGASRYLIMVDFDELIVPRRTHNYSEMIDQLDVLSNRKKRIGAYSMQNAFFYLQWPDDNFTFDLSEYPLAQKVSEHLPSLRKTWRRSRLHPQKQRSKYICDPEKVIEAGNHFVWEMASGFFTLSVPPHLSALHHYRVCEFGGNSCTKNAHVVDRSSHIFGKTLSLRIADQLRRFEKKCNLNIDDILKPQKLSIDPTTPKRS